MKKIFAIAFVSVGLLSVGCGSDDSAEKKDAENPAAEPAEEAVEETAETTEEAAEALKIQLDAFQDAATVTGADFDDGSKGLNLSGVVDGAGYAQCGLANGDEVKMIDGAAVPEGRAGVQALIDACSKGKAVTIMRGGEEMSVGQ